MGYHRISIGFVAAALLALPLQGLRADTAPKVIEEVDFAISCGPTSQQSFKHAVWTLHSFWYPEALKQFTAIAASEPGCAMAYWGIAMSHWYPLWYPVAGRAQSRLRGSRQGDSGPDPDAARGGLHRSDRRLLPRQ